MSEEYTEKQLKDADELAKALEDLPKETRGEVVKMASIFISGIKTGKKIASDETTAV